MNTRIVESTILVMMCALGLAGCGRSDSSPVMFAPSPPPPPPPPLPPPPQLAVDLTGNYALTFDVGAACEQVPKELRRRTYEARIEYKSSYASTDLFLAELSGATFHDQRPVVIEVTHRASGHTIWLDLAPSDNAILEETERGTFLMIAGGAGSASVEPTELSTISTLFTGYVNYCVATSEFERQHQCSFDSMIRSLCTSENSRWTLTRR